jgi:hypothetical protein
VAVEPGLRVAVEPGLRVAVEPELRWRWSRVAVAVEPGCGWRWSRSCGGGGAGLVVELRAWPSFGSGQANAAVTGVSRRTSPGSARSGSEMKTVLTPRSASSR